MALLLLELPTMPKSFLEEEAEARPPMEDPREDFDADARTDDDDDASEEEEEEEDTDEEEEEVLGVASS